MTLTISCKSWRWGIWRWRNDYNSEEVFARECCNGEEKSEVNVMNWDHLFLSYCSRLKGWKNGLCKREECLPCVWKAVKNFFPRSSSSSSPSNDRNDKELKKEIAFVLCYTHLNDKKWFGVRNEPRSVAPKFTLSRDLTRWKELKNEVQLRFCMMRRKNWRWRKRCDKKPFNWVVEKKRRKTWSYCPTARLNVSTTHISWGGRMSIVYEIQELEDDR